MNTRQFLGLFGGRTARRTGRRKSYRRWRGRLLAIYFAGWEAFLEDRDRGTPRAVPRLRPQFAFFYCFSAPWSMISLVLC